MKAISQPAQKKHLNSPGSWQEILMVSMIYFVIIPGVAEFKDKDEMYSVPFRGLSFSAIKYG